MENKGIIIDSLCLGYGENRIYDDFNVTFKPREIVSILGPSGCGKTTLLNSIVGIKPIETGAITGPANHRFGYVFQEPRLIPWLTVECNLEFAVGHTMSAKTYIEKRDVLLDTLELRGKLNRYPHQLSGGEQQRIALARAFLIPSEGLLMDEAFKGLDMLTKQAVIHAFIKLWSLSPKTVIAVSHDVTEAAMISDRILFFSKSPVRIVKDIQLSSAQIRTSDEATKLQVVNWIESVITGA